MLMRRIEAVFGRLGNPVTAQFGVALTAVALEPTRGGSVYA